MEEQSKLRETEIESRVAYQGKLLELREDRVKLSDGSLARREYVRHPGAVVIIPVLPDGQLLFERQFRYPLRRVFIELPAGKIDRGEDVLMTGQRELLEETGYVADQWRHLGLVHTCIGYSDERIEIFMAQGLRQIASQQLDQGEFLDVFSMPLDEALNAIRAGDISDAKTIAALFWAEKVLREGW